MHKMCSDERKCAKGVFAVMNIGWGEKVEKNWCI